MIHRTGLGVEVDDPIGGDLTCGCGPAGLGFVIRHGVMARLEGIPGGVMVTCKRRAVMSACCKSIALLQKLGGFVAALKAVQTFGDCHVEHEKSTCSMFPFFYSGSRSRAYLHNLPPFDIMPRLSLVNQIALALRPEIPKTVGLVANVADDEWNKDGVHEGDAGGSRGPAEEDVSIALHVCQLDQGRVKGQLVVVACHLD